MLGAAAIALGLVAGAAAQVDPRVPDLPRNALNGAIYSNYTCSLPFFGTQVFQVYFQGFIPLQLAPSQPYQIAGGTGFLILNSNITYGANLLGAKSADGNITNLGFTTYQGTNVPTSYNALQSILQLKNITWTVGASLPLKLPQTGVINTTPVTAGGASGSTLVPQLGNSNGTIQLKNANGQNVQGVLTVNCTQPSPPVLLPTINIRGAANTTGVSITPGTTNFNAISQPVQFQKGSFRFPSNCTFTGLSGVRVIDLYLTATIPTNAVSGGALTFSNGTGVIRIPQSVSNEIINANPGAATATGSVTAFNVLFSKTTQGGINVAATPLTFGPVSLAGNSAYANDVIVVLPSSSSAVLSGTVNVQTGTSGQSLVISAGTATGSFTLKNSSGGTVGGTVTVSCAASTNSLLVVPIA